MHVSQTYTLPPRKDRCWWQGRETKKLLIVVWGESVEHGSREYHTTEFYIDSQNQQGFRLRRVTIEDGPEETTFR